MTKISLNWPQLRLERWKAHLRNTMQLDASCIFLEIDQGILQCICNINDPQNVKHGVTTPSWSTLRIGYHCRPSINRTINRGSGVPQFFLAQSENYRLTSKRHETGNKIDQAVNNKLLKALRRGKQRWMYNASRPRPAGDCGDAAVWSSAQGIDQ